MLLYTLVLLYLFCIHSPQVISYCINDLIFLPTGQGLIAQFEELRNFWSVARKTRRKFYTSYHHSSHFRDILYSMCDIFEFETAITCLPIRADDLIKQFPIGYCKRKTNIDIR